jgi:hypothetical protein
VPINPMCLYLSAEKGRLRNPPKDFPLDIYRLAFLPHRNSRRIPCYSISSALSNNLFRHRKLDESPNPVRRMRDYFLGLREDAIPTRCRYSDFPKENKSVPLVKTIWQGIAKYRSYRTVDSWPLLALAWKTTWNGTICGGMDLAMSNSEWNSPAVSDTGAN